MQIIIWAKRFVHYLSFLFGLRKRVEWRMNMEILNWVIPLIHFLSHTSSIQTDLMSVYHEIQILLGSLLQVIYFTIFFQIYLVTVSHSDCLIYWSLLDFIFKTFDLSEIYDMLTAYISMCGGFRHLLINIIMVHQVVVCFQMFSRNIV